jgi:hypothetical protein
VVRPRGTARAPPDISGFFQTALAPRESDDGGAAYLTAVQEVAAALTAVVTGPTSKGEASTEVTKRVSPSVVRWCGGAVVRWCGGAVVRAVHGAARS